MAGQQGRTEPVTEMRILSGLALQPIVVAGVAYLLFPLLLLDGNGYTLDGRGRPGSVTDAALSVAFAVGLVSVPLVLLGVLPVLLWIRRRGQLTLARALTAGVLFGNVPTAIGYLAGGLYGPVQTAHTVAYDSAIGLAGAAVFWLVISPTRHDLRA